MEKIILWLLREQSVVSIYAESLIIMRGPWKIFSLYGGGGLAPGPRPQAPKGLRSPELFLQMIDIIVQLLRAVWSRCVCLLKCYSLLVSVSEGGGFRRYKQLADPRRDRYEGGPGTTEISNLR